MPNQKGFTYIEVKKMKKTTLLASLAVFASAAVVAAFALGGAGKFGNVRVNADPVEYSVTFNESNTTVEDVGNGYGIGTTTANGNKVGVVGHNAERADFTFKGVSFAELTLCEYELFMGGDGYSFSTITGFAISFSVEDEGEPVPFSLDFVSDGKNIYHIDSGKEYKGLSITADRYPMFMAMVEGGSVTVSSLTIWYSC